jgi:hypothetical protein
VVAVDLLTQEDRVMEDLEVVVAVVLSIHLVLSQQDLQHNHQLLVSLPQMELVILENQETLVVVVELAELVVLTSVKTQEALVSQLTLQVLQFLLVVAEEVKHNIQTLVLLLVQVVAAVVREHKVSLVVML